MNEQIIDLRTPENIKLLKKLPKSKLRYFVKEVKQYPSGDRNMKCFYDKPLYYVMDRPVSPSGVKGYDFWGNKTKLFCSYSDRDVAERIAFNRNFNFHYSFITM